MCFSPYVGVEGYGLSEVTWEPMLAFIQPDGTINPILCSYLVENNESELLTHAETLSPNLLDPTFLGILTTLTQGVQGTTCLCSSPASAAQEWLSLSPLRGALPKAIDFFFPRYGDAHGHAQEATPSLAPTHELKPVCTPWHCRNLYLALNLAHSGSWHTLNWPI